MGIFGAIDAADCAKGIILPHENVTAEADVTVLNGKKKALQVCTYCISCSRNLLLTRILTY